MIGEAIGYRISAIYVNCGAEVDLSAQQGTLLRPENPDKPTQTGYKQSYRAPAAASLASPRPRKSPSPDRGYRKASLRPHPPLPPVWPSEPASSRRLSTSLR